MSVPVRYRAALLCFAAFPVQTLGQDTDQCGRVEERCESQCLAIAECVRTGLTCFDEVMEFDQCLVRPNRVVVGQVQSGHLRLFVAGAGNEQKEHLTFPAPSLEYESFVIGACIRNDGAVAEARDETTGQQDSKRVHRALAAKKPLNDQIQLRIPVDERYLAFENPTCSGYYPVGASATPEAFSRLVGSYVVRFSELDEPSG